MNLPVSIMKALADETRLRIVALLLCERELCVCDIVDAVKLPQSTVSRHLSHLRRSGLVRDRRCGNWMYYSLIEEKEGFQSGLLDFLRRSVGELPSVKADRAYLESICVSSRCR